ncbi:MAG: bifunctional folylpolyglutamate synthase/dihydrofolate synthase [Dehalococcoidales bacterium]|nr:bifunctional folylpolyglutamate synthase/dihydrofolate synthase [Dehalococcoidales bacterium]
MSDSLYQQTLDYISSYTDYEKKPMPHAAANYDLRRMDELLARLGNPHLQAKSIHIAGTKGKGSIAAMVAAVLSASGYTTGLYTSPHLHTLRERIKVDGKLISEDELTTLVQKVKPEVEAVNRKATYGKLTTFELLTALGFTYFGQKRVDFQVLEVGLGGTFDATNVITPEVCVISNISLDHTAILGNTLTEIAGEKTGIIKPGCVVVTAPQSDDALQVIEKVCLEKGVPLVRVGKDVLGRITGFNWERQQLQVKGKLDNYELNVPLLGSYQLDNVLAAIATLEVLAEKGFNVAKDNIIQGLVQVKWPGRFQILNLHPIVMVDGAHNPESARKLRQSLEQYFDFNQAILIIGASSDKDIAGIISELISLFNKVIITRSIHPRAMATAKIKAEIKKYGVPVQETSDISAALPLALDQAGEKDLICITGSLFVVAGAIEQAVRLGLQK